MDKHDYLNKLGYVYTLLLEGGNYYVGFTERPVEQRFEEHVAGKGSYWTKTHKPIEIISYVPGNMLDENEITYRLMKEYGYEKVRGGIYVQKEYDSMPDEVIDMYGVKKRFCKFPPVDLYKEYTPKKKEIPLEKDMLMYIRYPYVNNHNRITFKHYYVRRKESQIRNILKNGLSIISDMPKKFKKLEERPSFLFDIDTDRLLVNKYAEYKLYDITGKPNDKILKDLRNYWKTLQDICGHTFLSKVNVYMAYVDKVKRTRMFRSDTIMSNFLF